MFPIYWMEFNSLELVFLLLLIEWFNNINKYFLKEIM
jgi:hypothetical protein